MSTGVNKPGRLAAAVLLVVGLGGCSATPPNDAPSVTTVESSTPASAAATATPLSRGQDYGENVPDAEPSPTWDADAREAAVQHAGATMTAFARPGLPERQWWDELAPLMTVSGQDAYGAVDPTEVPARQVTGEAVLVDDSSAWLARLEVPTDVGAYEVLLAREDATAPWRTETITPPAALSQPVGR
ncbi:hypothetical protein WDV85_16755 [Pseudokineococcus sp. 5B2Z-1]|uniref:hypothetical protein n=1 Tax=Pseudokineococcus sp. 5B2Z-1 TaxID=3132744 RepID=UPI0030AA82BF